MAKVFTYALIDNGREIDDTDAEAFQTEREAQASGERALDLVCPRLSPSRRFYRVEVRSFDGCPDCGAKGERKGHQACPYPQD